MIELERPITYTSTNVMWKPPHEGPGSNSLSQEGDQQKNMTNAATSAGNVDNRTHVAPGVTNTVLMTNGHSLPYQHAPSDGQTSKYYSEKSHSAGSGNQFQRQQQGIVHPSPSLVISSTNSSSPNSQLHPENTFSAASNMTTNLRLLAGGSNHNNVLGATGANHTASTRSMRGSNAATVDAATIATLGGSTINNSSYFDALQNTPEGNNFRFGHGGGGSPLVNTTAGLSPSSHSLHHAVQTNNYSIASNHSFSSFIRSQQDQHQHTTNSLNSGTGNPLTKMSHQNGNRLLATATPAELQMLMQGGAAAGQRFMDSSSRMPNGSTDAGDNFGGGLLNDTNASSFLASRTHHPTSTLAASIAQQQASSHNASKSSSPSNSASWQQNSYDGLNVSSTAAGGASASAALPTMHENKKRRTNSDGDEQQEQGSSLPSNLSAPNSAPALSPPQYQQQLPSLLMNILGGRATAPGLSIPGVLPPALTISQQQLNQMHLSTRMPHQLLSLQQAARNGGIGNALLRSPAGSSLPFPTVSSNIQSSSSLTAAAAPACSNVAALDSNAHQFNSNSAILSQHNQHQQEGVVVRPPSAAALMLHGGNGHVNNGHGRGLQQQRQIMSLKADEDQVWLSQFLCFLREEVCEVYKATEQDVRERKKSKQVKVNQVGIRCRFCCHLPHRERTGRSSCFPSSIDRIYQSVTMMIREHFSICDHFPAETRKKYMKLKQNTKKGEMESKTHWRKAAKTLGMMDVHNSYTGKGIFFREDIVDYVSDGDEEAPGGKK